MKRSRQLNVQREAKRAMQEVSWSIDDDDNPWPLPDRHAGDFGPPDDTDSEGGETDIEQEVQQREKKEPPSC